MHQYLSGFLNGNAVTFDRKKIFVRWDCFMLSKKIEHSWALPAALFSMAIALAFAVRLFT